MALGGARWKGTGKDWERLDPLTEHIRTKSLSTLTLSTHGDTRERHRAVALCTQCLFTKASFLLTIKPSVCCCYLPSRWNTNHKPADCAQHAFCFQNEPLNCGTIDAKGANGQRETSRKETKQYE